MKCISECTGIERPFHTLGISNFLQVQCVECNGFFSKKAINFTLEARYKIDSKFPYKFLMDFKKEMRDIVKAANKSGQRMPDGVYYNAQLENESEHIGHIYGNCHKRINNRYPDHESLIENMLINNRRAGENDSKI